LSQVLTIDKIAEKHGFRLGGFRSFERAITDEEIKSIKAYGQTDLIPKKERLRPDSQPVVGPALL
jgi:hypothetical protein